MKPNAEQLERARDLLAASEELCQWFMKHGAARICTSAAMEPTRDRVVKLFQALCGLEIASGPYTSGRYKRAERPKK